MVCKVCSANLNYFYAIKLAVRSTQIKVNSYVTMVLCDNIIETDNTLHYLTASAVYIREIWGRLLYTVHGTVEVVQLVFIVILFVLYCVVYMLMIF